MVLSPLVTNYENALQLDLIFSTEHPSSLMTLSLCQIDTQNQPVQYVFGTARICVFAYGGQRLRHITFYEDSKVKLLELLFRIFQMVFYNCI